MSLESDLPQAYHGSKFRYPLLASVLAHVAILIPLAEYAISHSDIERGNNTGSSHLSLELNFVPEIKTAFGNSPEEQEDNTAPFRTYSDGQNTGEPEIGFDENIDIAGKTESTATLPVADAHSTTIPPQGAEVDTNEITPNTLMESQQNAASKQRDMKLLEDIIRDQDTLSGKLAAVAIMGQEPTYITHTNAQGDADSFTYRDKFLAYVGAYVHFHGNKRLLSSIQRQNSHLRYLVHLVFSLNKEGRIEFIAYESAPDLVDPDDAVLKYYSNVFRDMPKQFWPLPPELQPNPLDGRHSWHGISLLTMNQLGPSDGPVPPFGANGYMNMKSAFSDDPAERPGDPIEFKVKR